MCSEGVYKWTYSMFPCDAELLPLMLTKTLACEHNKLHCEHGNNHTSYTSVC